MPECYMILPYQKDHAGWSGLVLSTLGVEEDTLASFLGPSCVMVGNVGLFILDICVDCLLGKRLLAEPEEKFDESEFAVASQYRPL